MSSIATAFEGAHPQDRRSLRAGRPAAGVWQPTGRRGGAGAATAPARFQDRTGGQFRPRPLAPPPRPAWTVPTAQHATVINPYSDIVSGVMRKLKTEAYKDKELYDNIRDAVSAGFKSARVDSTKLTVTVDSNQVAYFSYLKSYDQYLAKLTLLRDGFWARAEAKRKEAPAPPAENKPSEPLDAAELAVEKAKKARKTAARRRQRAAKRKRAALAKVESLETQIQLASLEKKLDRVVGPKKSKSDGAGKRVQIATEKVVGSPETVTPARQRVAKDENARARRNKKRQAVLIAPGRALDQTAPDIQVESAA